MNRFSKNQSQRFGKPIDMTNINSIETIKMHTNHHFNAEQEIKNEKAVEKHKYILQRVLRQIIKSNDITTTNVDSNSDVVEYKDIFKENDVIENVETVDIKPVIEPKMKGIVNLAMNKLIKSREWK